jgi:DNA invertase Pin-like site-specific DNA recombinase
MSAPCLTVPAWPPPLTPCRGYRIGYGRVSTRDQNPDSQRDALTAAGCDEIFTGKGASGKLASRPELDRALARLRPGDTLVITRLSRAMRSLRHLLELAAGLSERKVHLQVLKQGTGTSTPQGRLVFHVLGAIDEFQRELIVEGTYEGLGSARARGPHRGTSPGHAGRPGEARQPASRRRPPRVHHHPGSEDARRQPARAVPGARGSRGGRRRPAAGLKAGHRDRGGSPGGARHTAPG